MKILLADDHAIFREGLSGLLKNELGMEIVGEASNGLEVIKMAEQLAPELIIMDIAMPEMDGIQAVAAIKGKAPNIKIIMLSMHANNSYVKKALKTGASGFVLKESAFEELAAAISAVKQNRRYLSLPLVEMVVEDYIELSSNEQIQELYDSLTGREKEVFQFIINGFSRNKVAEQLSVSLKTVDQHKQSIKEKLNVKRQDELMEIASYLDLHLR